MGKKIKVGLLAIVGVLGLAAFAPSKAHADEDDWGRGGFYGERVERHRDFDRDGDRGWWRDRDWRRDRWERGYWRWNRFGRRFYDYR